MINVSLFNKKPSGSSGTTPTLQQVTDIGAVTTNTITIADGTTPAHAVTKRQLDLKANQTDLNTETLARQTADTALQNQINALPLNLISSTAALIPAGTYTRILDLVKAKGLGVWCVNGTDTANYTDLPVGVNTNTHLELKVTEIVAGSSTKNVILKEYNSAKSWHALINKDTVVYIKNWIALWSADNFNPNTKLNLTGGIMTGLTTFKDAPILMNADAGSETSIVFRRNGVEKGRLIGRSTGLALDGSAIEGIRINPAGYQTATNQLYISPTSGMTLGGNTVWHNGNLPYETGVWTPSIRSATNANYMVQQGSYVRIGNKVTVWVAIRATFNTIVTGTAVFIDGLPFHCSGKESVGTCAFSTRLTEIGVNATASDIYSTALLLSYAGVNTMAGMALEYGNTANASQMNMSGTVEYITV